MSEEFQNLVNIICIQSPAVNYLYHLPTADELNIPFYKRRVSKVLIELSYGLFSLQADSKTNSNYFGN